jgi:hypothetical protein
MLSSAFATKVNYEKNLSENIFIVSSQILSRRANIWFLSKGFIYIIVAAAVYDFGFLKCFSRNKNCLFRLDVSI